ncbi:MAG: HAD-IIB family hydrolase [Acidobacteria bacterium]|nr:MAG: HAD-IIB family hydrolase [Acidobacteriota bacterium]
MRISILFTDLDGTLLDLDGDISHEAESGLARLATLGVPVCALTSKTAAELSPLLGHLRISSPAGFENGAGILFPGGYPQLSDRAVPAWVLRDIADGLRRKTGAPLRTIWELTDHELGALTGLSASHFPAVRERLASAPLLVEEKWDQALAEALPPERSLTLVRGNRFLHLQGSHDKGTVVNRLLAAVPRPSGFVVACGDSPNDIPMLEAAEVRVIIPSALGPHPSLIERFPGAIVAPYPHGKGWAGAIDLLLNGTTEHEQPRYPS